MMCARSQPSLGMLLFVLVGCTCKADNKDRPQSLAPTSTVSRAAVGSAALPAATMTRADADAQAQTLLTAWVAAQSNRDFEAYQKLYAQDFVGVRRTPSGEEKRFDRAGWQEDRKRLFGASQKVAADNVKVTTWHEGAQPLGEIELNFIQRWRSPTVADHGPKVLRLRLGADGRLAIVFEELMSSAQGWQSDPATEVDATSLKTPLTVSATWRSETQGEIERKRMVFVVKDAIGRRKEWTVPYSECTDGLPPPAPFVKRNQGGILLDGNAGCGAEFSDNFRVVLDAAGIVIKNRILIHLHAEGAQEEDTGWVDLLRIRVAKGASVKAE